jgi:glycosyltransferase involved in cell wall biosynthesis
MKPASDPVGADRPAPRVSVIVNNYNYAGFVAEAIDSALAQRHPNLEVIVVDDGSTDDSRAVIAGYGERIRAVFKANGGQGSAFNAGFAASSGDIVMFLDADDRLYPDAVETVVAHWRPDLAKLMFRLDLVDAAGRFLDLFPAASIVLDSDAALPTLLRSGRYSTTVTSGMAFARAFLTQVLPIPEAEFRICADGYLLTVAPFHGRIGAIERPLGAYRKHGSNQWSPGGATLPLSGFHRSIDFDLAKYRQLEDQAARRGLSLPFPLGSRDHFHLMARLASLRLAPERHPVPGDVRWRLGWHGLLAAWRDSGHGTVRRGLLAIWFVWVALMPRALAAPAIGWLKAEQSRPRWLDRTIKFLRRSLLRRHPASGCSQAPGDAPAMTLPPERSPPRC